MTSEKRLGQGFWLLFWLATFGLLYLLFGHALDKRDNPNQQLSHTASEVVLKRNAAGHYVASGLVNGVPVVFMLDTGATNVAVPAHLQQQLGLKRGAEIITSTANGPSKAYLTEITELQLGSLILNNVRASINPGLQDNEILLGMSALKQVEFNQVGNTLTLRLP